MSVLTPQKEGALAGADQVAPRADEPSLALLVREALGAAAGEQPEVAGRLNARLRALPKDTQARAAADLLEGVLEAPSLGALVDEAGNSCRATAVEVLLSLGYPYALEVSPEDLAFLRARDGKTSFSTVHFLRRYLLYPLVAAELLLLGGVLWQYFPWAMAGNLWHLLAGLAHALVTVCALQAVVRTDPGTGAHAWSIALLALSGGLGVGLAAGGAFSALPTGLGAFAVCLLWRRA